MLTNLLVRGWLLPSESKFGHPHVYRMPSLFDIGVQNVDAGFGFGYCAIQRGTLRNDSFPALTSDVARDRLYGFAMQAS